MVQWWFYREEFTLRVGLVGKWRKKEDVELGPRFFFFFWFLLCVNNIVIYGRPRYYLSSYFVEEDLDFRYVREREYYGQRY